MVLGRYLIVAYLNPEGIGIVFIPNKGSPGIASYGKLLGQKQLMFLYFRLDFRTQGRYYLYTSGLGG